MRNDIRSIIYPHGDEGLKHLSHDQSTHGHGGAASADPVQATQNHLDGTHMPARRRYKESLRPGHSRAERKKAKDDYEASTKELNRLRKIAEGAKAAITI